MVRPISYLTRPLLPPSWVFAPAWAINNCLTLASNLRIANLSPTTPRRREALAFEALSWALFASFSGLYFGLRSPTLGAVNTVLGLVTTVHGITVTAKLDRAAGWLLAPRLAWLTYPSYISVATAIRSPDDLITARGRLLS